MRNNLYEPLTSSRYIYKHKKGYIAILKTPFYRTTKIFKTIEECKSWIDKGGPV